MENYQVIRPLGDGSYGTVNLAKLTKTGDMVAIKKFKQLYRSWQDVIKLSEVRSLRALRHANIVKLIEVFRQESALYMVFEFMTSNLYDLIKERSRGFGEPTVRNITYQILQGLAFMHKNGYFHRDLKPENILCSGLDSIKLADFGLAKEIRSRPPYTEYVSTRWYRAPEVLVRARNYNSPIDMWAVGAIMAEVYTLRPLFPGSSEIDQIFKICSIIGAPTKETWNDGLQLAIAMRIKFPPLVPTPLRTIASNASNEGIKLMTDLMRWDPKLRPTAAQALQRHFFTVAPSKPAADVPPPRPTQQVAKHRFQPGPHVPAGKPVKHDSDDDFDFEWSPNKPAYQLPARENPDYHSKTGTETRSGDHKTAAHHTKGVSNQQQSREKSFHADIGAIGDDRDAKRKQLARKESVQSIISNFSLAGGPNSTMSAANYYVAKSRYSPVSGGSRIPKHRIGEAKLPHQAQFPTLDKALSHSTTQVTAENKWKSRPSYQQLELGPSKWVDKSPQAGAFVGSKWASKKPDLPVAPVSLGGVGKTGHRTNWAAKYGGNK